MKTQQSTKLKSSQAISSEESINLAGEDIWFMIAEAAYFHAESRGFQGGDMDEDWYRAEEEIKGMLAQERPH